MIQCSKGHSPEDGKMRIIMIVGDGMADRPLKELGYRTPLDAIDPENMNGLASNGISGLLDPIAPGIAPGSDAANLAILGYNPWKIGGRGSFEAAGAGIQLAPGDVAFRCNFATVSGSYILIDERAGRIGEEAAELAQSLADFRLRDNSDVNVVFRQTLGFKGALVLRGEGLSPKVAAVMPKVGKRVDFFEALDDTVGARKTADTLKEFVIITHKLLKEHPVNIRRMSLGMPPANALVPWSPGEPPLLESFHKKYGLRGACVAAVGLIKGIAKLMGMSVVDVFGATGDVDTNTLAKADAALKAICDHEFVLVHVEGPDEASHAGDIEGKVSIIKGIDSMVARIVNQVNLDKVCVVLLSDHATSLRLRRHTGDPVPVVVASSKIVRDGVERYCEKAACKGSLCRIRGKQVMPLILNLLGVPEL